MGRIGQVAILSGGIWRQRHLLRAVTPFRMRLWRPPVRRPDFDAVAGWGRKATSEEAAQLAEATGKPYIALEDGPLRCVRPGSGEESCSFFIDRTGVHYDVSGPSDLEHLIEGHAAAPAAPATIERARRGMALLKELQLSKYNNGLRLSPLEMGLDPTARRRVLVVDQTRGDGSILFGMANGGTFRQMVMAAIRENPGAEIVVKTHPEVVAGRKRGYFEDFAHRRVTVIDFPVNPWSLLAAVDSVYVVTSQLGFEALMAGKRVTCFGAPFYAGWGLTEDRVAIPRRVARPTLEQVFAATYFDYAHYVDPTTCKATTFEGAVQGLAARRDAYEHMRAASELRTMPLGALVTGRPDGAALGERLYPTLFPWRF